jgi:hypothetical protein
MNLSFLKDYHRAFMKELSAKLLIADIAFANVNSKCLLQFMNCQVTWPW